MERLKSERTTQITDTLAVDIPMMNHVESSTKDSEMVPKRKSRAEMQCRFCRKFCFSASEKEEHEKGHIEDKKLSCPVPGCSRGFRRCSYLEEHISAVHRGEKPFVCQYCPKSFSLRCNLKRHIRIHTGEKPFSCSICREAFTLKKNMKEHERVHTGERPFACTWCELRFSRRSSLVRHAHTAHTEKPFKCSECNGSFATSYYLKRHVSVHADRSGPQAKRKRRTKAQIAEDIRNKSADWNFQEVKGSLSTMETSFNCLTDNNIFDDQHEDSVNVPSKHHPKLEGSETTSLPADTTGSDKPKPVEVVQPCQVILPKMSNLDMKPFDLHEEKEIISQHFTVEVPIVNLNSVRSPANTSESANNEVSENRIRQLVISLPRINLSKLVLQLHFENNI